MHSEWIKYIWNSKTESVLQAHRGSYKTTAIAVIGSIWWLLFNPNHRIAIVRKTFTDAASVTKAIELIMILPEIREIFKLAHEEYPEFTMRRNGALTFSFKKTVTPEASITPHGLDYGLTGKHYDKILCDDFVTLRDRISTAERITTKEVIREIRTNIIEPGQPVYYIGTPWHKFDAWTLLPEPVKFDAWSCGILTEKQIEEKKRMTTPSLFAANYKLKHQASETALFTDPKEDRWSYRLENKCYGHLDAAFDGDHYCALTFAARRKSGELQAVGFVFSGNVKDWVSVIKAKYDLYRCKLIYNETNPDKGFTADLLRSNGMNVKEYTESENKHNKIATHLYKHWDNILWDMHDTEGEYMEMILDYAEKQEPDDSCFIAGTKIITLLGNKNIEDIKKDDKVLTPFGFKKVIVAGCTGERKVISNIGLTGTSNHKIFNKNKSEFVPLVDSLTCLISCSKFSLRSLIKWKTAQLLFLMGRSIQKRENIISVNCQIQKERIVYNCIEQFGNFIINKRYLKAIMFIIKILIQIIMIFLTWSWLKVKNILDYMLKGIWKILNTSKKIKRILLEHKKKLKNGIEVKKVWNGIGNMLSALWARLGLLGNKGHVYSAIKSIQQNIPNRCIVQNYAGVGTGVQLMENINCAQSAGKGFILKKELEQIQSIVVADVVINTDIGTEKKQKVYNLTVEDVGVYYANGILVSNCDSAASLLREHFSGTIGDEELWKW